MRSEVRVKENVSLLLLMGACVLLSLPARRKMALEMLHWGMTLRCGFHDLWAVIESACEMGGILRKWRP